MYEKLTKVLTNKRLMNGIEKASPFDQTSSLEGFHSVLNHFAGAFEGEQISRKRRGGCRGVLRGLGAAETYYNETCQDDKTHL